MTELIDKLRRDGTLSREEFRTLLEGRDDAAAEYLFDQACRKCARASTARTSICAGS